MTEKYPDFSPEFDMDAFEILLYQLVKTVSRKSDTRTATFLKGLLIRSSPMYRAKLGPMGPCEELDVAHYKDWPGEE